MSRRRRGRRQSAGRPGTPPGGEAARSDDGSASDPDAAAADTDAAAADTDAAAAGTESSGEAPLSGEAVGAGAFEDARRVDEEPGSGPAGIVLDDDGNPVIPDAGPRPPLLIAAVVLTFAQAGLLLVWAVLIWIEVFGRAGEGPISSGVSLGVFLAGFGAALAGVALQFWRGMRWARSATVAWQLTSGVAGIAMATTGVPAGLLVLIPNLAVLVGTFSPRALTWFERQLSAG